MTGGDRPLVVLDVVGLTPRLLPQMPALARLGEAGLTARLDTVFPAVTCTVQSTFLTGGLARDHGIVGNGWYFRDLGEVLLWRQHNALVGGEKLWDAARRQRPGARVANVCWWYAIGAATDMTVTPRPIYHADGRKSPDCYTWPPELHAELTSELGTFPLFQYWGPGAGLASSRWIIGAAGRVLERRRPDVLLVYVPHLDYDLQRFGPDGPEAIAAAQALDRELAPFLDVVTAAGATTVVLSEYGITAAHRPIDINRALRRAGLLTVTTQGGMEYLDAPMSAAFALADHQVAHVYVRDPAEVATVRSIVAAIPGVAEVLDAEGKERLGVDHERAGELVAIAEPDAWFTYYYWLDAARAPDFARLVDIHRKPGYDPAELFMDPADRWVKVRAGAALARKAMGFRYLMNVVPLDPSIVRGSHGRLPDDPNDGPLFLSSERDAAPERVAAVDVKSVLLDLIGAGA